MPPLSKAGRIAGLVGWLVLSFTAAAVGAVATAQAQHFYAQLVRPDWAPPAWLFGPVWTVLYAMIGLAAWMAWLVWRTGGLPRAGIPLGLFIAQLGLNAVWSWVFFHWHLGLLSFVNIAVLWLLILATLITFWRIRPLAGALLLPYLLWVSFASVLNYAAWRLNPQILR